MRSLSRWTIESLSRVLVAAVVAALMTAVLAAPPARAAEKQVKIKGRGWGHGIGMSQYGAYGFSLNGRRSGKILRHYYSGANVVKKATGERVRVGMLQSRSSITIRPRAKAKDGGRLVLKVQGSKAKVVTAHPGDALRLEASSAGGGRIYKNGKRIRRDGRSIFGDTKHAIVAKYARYGTQVDTDGKGYAVAYGKIEFVSYSSSACSVGKCFAQVAVLGMQKYLYGLGEVPSSWPQQTLRAQAIAGRTYAYSKILAGQRRVPCYCGLYDSVADQVFVGEAKRTGSGSYWKGWKKAVDATLNKVILHNGTPISALYSSSSGGHTESNSFVWGTTQVPYLKGVNDPYDRAGGANPNFRWSLKMSWSTLKSKLANSFGSFGKLKKLKIVRKGVSGRVATNGLKIVGSTRKLIVDGWDVRNALGLKDTWFRFKVIEAASVSASAGATEQLAGEPKEPKPDPAESPSPPPSPTTSPTPSPAISPSP
ncbi:MAG: SpoIID/LytB domain-containing protein [Actinomycetota bacterium]